jgi:hypothetical protein
MPLARQPRMMRAAAFFFSPTTHSCERNARNSFGMSG